LARILIGEAIPLRRDARWRKAYGDCVKVYTLQIGSGGGETIEALEHAETFGADDLVQAIVKAKTIIQKRSWHPDSNTVRLLEEFDGDSRLMWVLPLEVIRF
jgi:hypothetical protein